MCLSPQPRAFFEHQHIQKWSKHVMFWRFWLPNVPFATAACIFSTSAHTKVVQTRHVLKILTSKCAFRHSRVHFFNISTHKSGPNTSCFVHFDFKMYVSPQWRAIFRHQNYQKCSRNAVFCTFSLPNAPFATAACIFSTSARTKSGPNTSCFVHFDFKMYVSPQWRAIFRHLNFEKCSRTLSFLTFSLPNVLFATVAYNFATSALTKVLWGLQFFNICTSECAFRHSGVQFLI